MKALIFGAGNIGRGHIAQFLSDAGYEIVFADINEHIVNKIQTEKAYRIIFLNNDLDIQRIENVYAYNSITQKDEVISVITEADLILTAVGPSNLKNIATLIAEGIKHRLQTTKKPFNIIACENMVNGTSCLKRYIFDYLTEEEIKVVEILAGFPNAAIDRIVPNQSNDTLDVQVEPYFEWVVEKDAFKSGIPPVKAFHLVNDITRYIDRKLYTVNAGHATLAYNGYKYNCVTIAEAMNHPQVQEIFWGVLKETGKVLEIKHGFERSELEEYWKKTGERFKNEKLVDHVTRVGRRPIRKIGPSERLVYPAVELMKYGMQPTYLAKTIAAVLVFSNYPDDQEAKELAKKIKEVGPKRALAFYTKLDLTHPLIDLVMKNL